MNNRLVGALLFCCATDLPALSCWRRQPTWLGGWESPSGQARRVLLGVDVLLPYTRGTRDPRPAAAARGLGLQARGDRYCRG